MITKGALDVLLSRVVKIETSEGIIDFTEEHRKEIEQVNREFFNRWITGFSFCL